MKGVMSGGVSFLFLFFFILVIARELTGTFMS